MRNNTAPWVGASADRNNFLPASRYYGDKYARTMEEAFGPGAQLDKEPEEFDPAVCMLIGAVFLAGLLGLVLSVCLWITRG
jgi:hypothetical protein